MRRPRLWLALWWLAVLSVIVVCLIPPPPLPDLPKNSDKVEHFLAYFILAGSAVQIYRTRAALWCAAVGLVVMGIGVEFAQGALTDNRSADPMDALANTVGVVAGMALRFTPVRDLLVRLKG